MDEAMQPKATVEIHREEIRVNLSTGEQGRVLLRELVRNEDTTGVLLWTVALQLDRLLSLAGNPPQAADPNHVAQTVGAVMEQLGVPMPRGANR